MIGRMAGAAAHLATCLRRRFACSGLQPGDLLPSVRAIEEEFATSRSVVTEALDLLAAEGVLIRHHGRGTYLARIPTLAAAGVQLALVLAIDLDPRNTYLERLLTGLTDAAGVHQCSLAVRTVGADGSDLAGLVAGSTAAGLILIGEVTAAVLAAAVATGQPCVVASGRAVTSLAAGASWVGHDDREGAYQATQHLLALGRRRIAWIAGDLALPYNQERLAGHLEALGDAGLEPDPTLLGHGQSVSPAVRALLAWSTPPDAAMLSGDYLALNTYDAITAGGRQVGRDCSVVGFDDLAQPSGLQPALTTMRAEIEALGGESLRLLLRRIAGGGPETTLIPRRLIRRGSTCSAFRSDPGV